MCNSNSSKSWSPHANFESKLNIDFFFVLLLQIYLNSIISSRSRENPREGENGQRIHVVAPFGRDMSTIHPVLPLHYEYGGAKRNKHEKFYD